jgi:peroxiredoxin
VNLTHPLCAAIATIAVTAGLTLAAAYDGNVAPDPSLRPRALDVSSAEPPVAIVALGDEAPDVSWEGEGGSWLHLHDLLAQGPVLLVVAPDHAEMKALQAQSEALTRLGVVPAVVLDRRSGAARGAARKAGLTCTVIPDPHRVIATQFNLIRRNTLSAAPGWFVIDRKGVVRDLQRGSVAVADWSGLAADALAIPAPDAPLPATSR